MFRNYLTVAIRNVMRQKLYAGINILGLAIGMACCLLILLYIQSELGYNSHYPHADRIFKVIRGTKTETGSQTFSALTSGPLGPEMQQQFPEVEETTRLYRLRAWIKVPDAVHRLTLCVSDPNLFEFFNFKLVAGDLKSAFQDPQGVVLSETTAAKLFGNRNPIGESIEIEEFSTKGVYVVRGIMEDLPKKSTVQFDLVCPVAPTNRIWIWDDWLPTEWRSIETFVLLSQRNLASSLRDKMQALLGQHMGETIAQHNQYELQPFDEVYLYSARDYDIQKASSADGMVYGDLNAIYFAVSIATAVLVIACINFINLATARSAKRAREVGLRKTVGASFGHLITQFLGESILLTLVAVFFAVGLVEVTLPVFGNLVGKPLTGDFLTTPVFSVFLVVLVGVVGVLAGGYPAFALSRYHPVDALKSQRLTLGGGQMMRKALVVFQFVVSVVLIVGVLVSHMQLSYLRNRDMGFDKTALVEIPIFVMSRDVPSWGNYGWELKQQYNTVKAAFLKHPRVLAATSTRYPPSGYSPREIFQAEGTGNQDWPFRVYPVDEDFMTTFGIDLLKGRQFSSAHTELAFWERDQKNLPETFVLTESAVKQLGWEDPLGKRLTGHGRTGTVIGVVKDFHFQSLKQVQEPAVLVPEFEHLKMLYLKIDPTNFEETRAFLEETWKRFLPTRPFSYQFLDDRLNAIYAEEVRLERLFTMFATLAILVGCLGLFGLASYMALQRTREIGIRKVLGASVAEVVMLLVRDFAKLIVLAVFIALPVAYYMMAAWLENFPYRIDLTPLPFLLSGLIALGVALLTVMQQALSAALADPVDALQQE